MQRRRRLRSPALCGGEQAAVTGAHGLKTNLRLAAKAMPRRPGAVCHACHGTNGRPGSKSGQNLARRCGGPESCTDVVFGPQGYSAGPASQGRTNRTTVIPDRRRSPVRLAVRSCHLPDKL